MLKTGSMLLMASIQRKTHVVFINTLCLNNTFILSISAHEILSIFYVLRIPLGRQHKNGIVARIIIPNDSNMNVNPPNRLNPIPASLPSIEESPTKVC